MDEVLKERIEWWVWVCAWPLFHVGAEVLPQKFFEHVVIGLSVYAIVTTQGDKIKSTRAAVAAEGKDDEVG